MAQQAVPDAHPARNDRFFGFIGIVFTLWLRGTRLPYPKLRVFQFKVLLPVWLVGEGIALVNALVKALFRVRIYDYI